MRNSKSIARWSFKNLEIRLKPNLTKHVYIIYSQLKSIKHPLITNKISNEQYASWTNKFKTKLY
jgi:hypothetical protein